MEASFYRNKILPGGRNAPESARRQPHPFGILATIAGLAVLITELILRLSDGFGGVLFVFWFLLVLLIVGLVTFFRRQMPPAKSAADSSLLIAETEAFLSGEYANYLRSLQRGVPGWAWLNGLAHGGLPGLRETQRSTRILSSAMRVADRSWYEAQTILGRDLLWIVKGDPRRLTFIQQSILVPLELRLMELEANDGLTAYELVQATRAALRPTP
jgi:hypothetical protein